MGHANMSVPSQKNPAGHNVPPATSVDVIVSPICAAVTLLVRSRSCSGEPDVIVIPTSHDVCAWALSTVRRSCTDRVIIFMVTLYTDA